MEWKNEVTHKWVVFGDSVIDMMKIEAVTPAQLFRDEQWVQGAHIHTRTQKYAVVMSVGEVLEIMQEHA